MAITANMAVVGTRSAANTPRRSAPNDPRPDLRTVWHPLYVRYGSGQPRPAETICWICGRPIRPNESWRLVACPGLHFQMWTHGYDCRAVS